MAPTHPTPHSIISFLPNPTAPITTLSSHSINSLLPSPSVHATDPSQSFSSIGVSHANLSSLTSNSHHSINSMDPLGSLSHPQSLLPTSMSSLSLSSPFQITNHLLQSPLGLAAHHTHTSSLLHNQLTQVPPIGHLSTSNSSPHRNKNKCPKSPKRKVTSVSKHASAQQQNNLATTEEVAKSKSDISDIKISKSLEKVDSTAKEQVRTSTPPLPSLENSLSTPTKSPTKSKIESSLAPSQPNEEVANTREVQAETSNSLTTSVETSTSSSTVFHNQSATLTTTVTSSVESPLSDKTDNVAEETTTPTNISTSANTSEESKPTQSGPPPLLLTPPKEEKINFDKHVSNFSSSVNYSLPITTIYMKHIRDLQHQQQLKQEPEEFNQPGDYRGDSFGYQGEPKYHIKIPVQEQLNLKQQIDECDKFTSLEGFRISALNGTIKQEVLEDKTGILAIGGVLGPTGVNVFTNGVHWVSTWLWCSNVRM